MHFNIKNILSKYGFTHKDAYNNIYINLYNSIRKAITNRALDENVKLPPSRVLAKDLEISRSTVLKALDILLLEKYIIAIHGSGYFVAPIEKKKIYHNLNTPIPRGKYPKISKRAIAFNKNIHIINSESNKGIAFRPGLPPLDIFPVQQWKNLSNQYWRKIKSSELSYSNSLGLESLRKNIAIYLKMYRNIVCDPNQIIITSGSLHSLYLIANSLIDENDEVIIENPTYPHAYHLFNSLKAKICPTKIDLEGISINNIKCQNPKLIYTTPSNQYPTGIKMSLKRRLELLKWASAKNALIIEDDYDHEFSNWENSISSIYSLDKQERVIYLGTFNKLLHPSIRLGYMIVPRYLLKAITSLYEQSSRFVATSMQKTLSSFIEKDYLNKHLRNVIEVSKERKEIFFDNFNSKFSDEISLDSNNSGLHIIANLNEEVEDIKFANDLNKNTIIAHPYRNYFIEGAKKNGLIMGYSSVNNKVIKDTIAKMANIYAKY